MRAIYNPNELWHFGTKGQKWGVRRYQNPDGSLTAAGRQRYGGIFSAKIPLRGGAQKEATVKSEKKGLTDKQKTALKVGAAVAVSALAVYGGYKLAKTETGQRIINSGKQKINDALKRNRSESPDKLRQAQEALKAHQSKVNEASSTIDDMRSKAQSLSRTVNRTPVSRTVVNRTPVSRTVVNRTPVSRVAVNRTPVSRTVVNRTPVSRVAVNRTPGSEYDKLRQAQEALRKYQQKVNNVDAVLKRRR